jgi:hypothetical protein
LRPDTTGGSITKVRLLQGHLGRYRWLNVISPSW